MSIAEISNVHQTIETMASELDFDNWVLNKSTGIEDYGEFYYHGFTIKYRFEDCGEVKISLFGKDCEEEVYLTGEEKALIIKKISNIQKNNNEKNRIEKEEKIKNSRKVLDTFYRGAKDNGR